MTGVWGQDHTHAYACLCGMMHNIRHVMIVRFSYGSQYAGDTEESYM